ncbi:MAG: c-type cytochrome [Pseudomonadota bacterium]
MKRIALTLVVLIAAGAIAFWALTIPQPPSATRLAAITAHNADAVRGETIFWLAGCASCHSVQGADGDARLELVGGYQLQSDFGTFVAPNISMHPEDGIGAWSLTDFAASIIAGVSPDGRHYYPAFPFASYRRMTDEDIADLWAFWQTLPAIATPADQPVTALGFPFNIRRGVGLWKLAFLSDAPFVDPASLPDDPQIARGQYLTEGMGHCGECHTSRNFAGALNADVWLAGAPNPSGRGGIPNITPHPDGIESWSADDIAFSLESGFTPDFNSFGGTMASVVKNYANVSPEDRLAIAAYLKAIAPLPDAN